MPKDQLQFSNTFDGNEIEIVDLCLCHLYDFLQTLLNSFEKIPFSDSSIQKKKKIQK